MQAKSRRQGKCIGPEGGKRIGQSWSSVSFLPGHPGWPGWAINTRDREIAGPRLWVIEEGLSASKINWKQEAAQSLATGDCISGQRQEASGSSCYRSSIANPWGTSRGTSEPQSKTNSLSVQTSINIVQQCLGIHINQQHEQDSLDRTAM